MRLWRKPACRERSIRCIARLTATPCSRPRLDGGRWPTRYSLDTAWNARRQCGDACHRAWRFAAAAGPGDGCRAGKRVLADDRKVSSKNSELPAYPARKPQPDLSTLCFRFSLTSHPLRFHFNNTAEGAMRVVVVVYCGFDDIGTCSLRRGRSTTGRRTHLAYRSCAHVISPGQISGAAPPPTEPVQAQPNQRPAEAPVVRGCANDHRFASRRAGATAQRCNVSYASTRRAGAFSRAHAAGRQSHSCLRQSRRDRSLARGRDRHDGRSRIRDRTLQAIRLPARQGSRADLRRRPLAREHADGAEGAARTIASRRPSSRSANMRPGVRI